MTTLTLNCPSCGRPAKIQSQFTAMKLVHYVYQCGHLEIRPATLSVEDKEVNSIQVKSNPVPRPEIESLCIKEDCREAGHCIHWSENAECCNCGAPGLVETPLIDEILTKEDILNIERMTNEGYQEYSKPDNTWYSLDFTKKAYPFQVDGVKFAEKALPLYSGCLIADEMGLGKTIQALLILKRHWAQLTPCLIIVKGSTILQWQREMHEWTSDKLSSCVPVTDRCHLIPGFKTYIISMDLLGAKGIKEAIAKIKPKAVIIDECQNFKDTDSLRTRSLVKIIKENNIQFKIALSGTPIKNRVTEYFPILNLLDPRTFYSYTGFCRTWLSRNEKGQYVRLDPFMTARFEEITSKYILRRMKKDVLKNLPELTRDFQYITIDDPLVKKSYNSEVELLKNFLNTAERIDSTSLLGWLARMRAITGQAKCQYAVDWTQDFIDSTEESLAIGIHHKSVRDTLHTVFSTRGLNPLKLSGEDNVYAKNRIQSQFNSGEARMLIINMLAGGIGLNLQSCSNTLVLELPWNPADMEQFIGRFHRDGQKKNVTATYVLAKGTIDEFMHKLIYEKSVLSSEAGIKIAPHANMDELMNNPTFLKEFAEFVANHKI